MQISSLFVCVSNFIALSSCWITLCLCPELSKTPAVAHLWAWWLSLYWGMISAILITILVLTNFKSDVADRILHWPPGASVECWMYTTVLTLSHPCTILTNTYWPRPAWLTVLSSDWSRGRDVTGECSRLRHWTILGDDWRLQFCEIWTCPDPVACLALCESLRNNVLRYDWGYFS